jgi:transposase
MWDNVRMAQRSSPSRRSSVGHQGGGVRPRRDFAALEKRRLAAARLFERGLTPAEVARRLEVSCQSAVTWLRAWESQGRAGLRGARRAGRLPRLSAEQLSAVEAALLEGARAHGYNTDLWTLARVAEVIEQVTGIGYHQGHVWRILRSMGWSRQKPARRAVERDDEAVARWVRDAWPQVKKTPDAARRGSFSKTRAASH